METFLTCLDETHDAKIDGNINSTVSHADNNPGGLTTNDQADDA